MSTRLIVVIGVTGLQGGSVARLFARKPGWRVRGVTRDPEKPSNTALRDLGVEIVRADLNDRSSLDAAFQNANVIFANTDFFHVLFDPTAYEEAEGTKQSMVRIAYDREVQQGKNAVDAAAKNLETLDLFIWSTLSDAKKWGQEEFQVDHFSSKAAVVTFLREQQPQLAAKSSYLQMGMYLCNWRINPSLRPHKQADGKFSIKVLKEFGESVEPLVNPPHDTGVFVQALINAPPGTHLLGASEQMRYTDLWKLWARIKGVELKLEERLETDVEEMPEWLSVELKDSQLYCAKYGYTGGDPEVKTPEDLGIEASQLTNIEDWLRQEDFSSIM